MRHPKEFNVAEKDSFYTSIVHPVDTRRHFNVYKTSMRRHLKKVFLEISEAYNFIKKESMVQVLSCLCSPQNNVQRHLTPTTNNLWIFSYFHQSIFLNYPPGHRMKTERT